LFKDRGGGDDDREGGRRRPIFAARKRGRDGGKEGEKEIGEKGDEEKEGRRPTIHQGEVSEMRSISVKQEDQKSASGEKITSGKEEVK